MKHEASMPSPELPDEERYNEQPAPSIKKSLGIAGALALGFVALGGMLKEGKEEHAERKARITALEDFFEHNPLPSSSFIESNDPEKNEKLEYVRKWHELKSEMEDLKQLEGDTQ